MILAFKAIISVVSPQLMFMVMLAQLAVLWPVVVRRNTEGLLVTVCFPIVAAVYHRDDVCQDLDLHS